MNKMKFITLGIGVIIAFSTSVFFSSVQVAHANSLDEWKDLVREYIEENKSLLNDYGIEKARQLSRSHPVTWSEASSNFNIQNNILLLGFIGKVRTDIGECNIRLNLEFLANDNGSRKYPFYFTYSDRNLKVNSCRNVARLFRRTINKKARKAIDRAIQRGKNAMVAEVNFKMKNICQTIESNYGN